MCDAAAQDLFILQNTFECKRLKARITFKQCEINRSLPKIKDRAGDHKSKFYNGSSTPSQYMPFGCYDCPGETRKEVKAMAKNKCLCGCGRDSFCRGLSQACYARLKSDPEFDKKYPRLFKTEKGDPLPERKTDPELRVSNHEPSSGIKVQSAPSADNSIDLSKPGNNITEKRQPEQPQEPLQNSSQNIPEIFSAKLRNEILFTLKIRFLSGLPNFDPKWCDSDKKAWVEVLTILVKWIEGTWPPKEAVR